MGSEPGKAALASSQPRSGAGLGEQEDQTSSAQLKPRPAARGAVRGSAGLGADVQPAQSSAGARARPGNRRSSQIAKYSPRGVNRAGY